MSLEERLTRLENILKYLCDLLIEKRHINVMLDEALSSLRQIEED